METGEKNRPKRFDLIAFDWDGTLSNSTAVIVHCIQAAVADVGGKPPSDDQASYVIGMSLMQALTSAAPDVPPEKHAELANCYRYHYIQHQADISLFAGVLPMLQTLRARGHLLTVATGKSRRGLDDALQDPLLKGVFDGSRTADETAGKPNPLMLEELMSDFGVEPDRLLMIGDTTHDLEMARNAGCASLAVAYGAHPPENFARYEPLYVAHSVAQLRDWLLENA